jgi:regulator of protease activity HflC (stomatin/prohibitin superfamily)
MVVTGVLLLTGLVLICRSGRVLEKHHRGVLFRRGRFEKILEPGFHLVLPYADRLFRINVDEKIPMWREISAAELEDKLKEVVIMQLK